MATRSFRLLPESTFSACPKCGNREAFTARAERCAEDCCDVWVECGVCGHDPTAERWGARLEDVWGSLDHSTIMAAMGCREDALHATTEPSPRPSTPEGAE